MDNYISSSFFDECWDTIPSLDVQIEDLLSSNFSEPENINTNNVDFNADDLLNFLDDDSPQFPSPPSPTTSLVSNTSDYSSGSSTKDFIDNNSQSNFAVSPVKIEAEPPPIKKPKTLILSQKDFKALMDKIKNGSTDMKSEFGCKKVVVKRTYSKANAAPQPLPKIVPAAAEKIVKPPSPVPFVPDLKPSMVVDERLLKRQVRMMKNRESASISRKRKIDYLSSLEKENMELKQENSCLRSQLLNFAQICKCKHVQISDFVTNKFTNKTENLSFGKKNFLSPASKKNTAVLLAMVFMVSLNFGRFSLPSFNENDSTLLNPTPADTYTGGRHLLWYSNENEENANGNDIAEGPMTANEFEKYEKSQQSKCGAKSNQTENMRLAMELQRWIKVNNVHNISSIDESLEVLKLSMNFLETTNFRKMFKKTLKNRRFFGRHRNLFDNGSTPNADEKPSPGTFMNVYKSKFSDEYSKLFEEIGRRNDTFYVLTFNADNIYLPASAYNKSNRPKMSLMVPTKDFSTGIEQVTLLQIDCEVLNTTHVHLNADAIPTDLKHKVVFNENKTEHEIPRTKFKYSNASSPHSKVPLYRPYFIDKFNPKFKNQVADLN